MRLGSEQIICVSIAMLRSGGSMCRLRWIMLSRVRQFKSEVQQVLMAEDKALVYPSHNNLINWLINELIPNVGVRFCGSDRL
jgi:hypothetical protein